MLFTELNADVLIQIYGYLDLIDSINLAQTCTRLRDVGQQNYKRFEIFNLEHYLHQSEHYNRHNRIDATIVLKHMGPFIRALEANLDANKIGLDVSPSIRKYCVNVKALNIIEGYFKKHYNPYTEYSEWLRKLSLTKISVSSRDLFLIDLSETTTLDELHIHDFSGNCHCFWARKPVDFHFGFVADIFERNCNISYLRIPLTDGFQYEIFEKLKCVKRLVLDIKCSRMERPLEKVAPNLKMAALEKLELHIASCLRRIDGLSEFLQGLSEKALHLKDLSIYGRNLAWDTNTLPSIQLLKLTSLRVMVQHPNLYEEIPKIQPNLTHLDLWMYDHTMKPMEQIISLINNLEKLELLRIRHVHDLQSLLRGFLQETVLCRIFDCRSINRPTVILKLFDRFELEVELDFKAHKWTFKDHIDLVETKETESSLAFNYTTVETIRDVKRFSGTVTDFNSVKDEAIQWIKGL